MEYIELGDTGISVSRLAIGTGTHGWAHRSDQTDLGVDGLADLLRIGYEAGVNFWDAADQYGSHPHLKRALQDIPREKVVIQTKTNSRTGEGVREDVARFLRELDVDFIDIVLMHYMTSEDWPDRYAEAMEALSQAQEQGKIGAVGVSCHGLGPLSAAAAHDWPEVILARINMAGVNMGGRPDQVTPILERMYQQGKAVVGMKVMGCGRLGEQGRQAIAFALGLGTVYALTIGVTNEGQLRQNIRWLNELAPDNPLLDR
jgi:aryl-alcohol dehydrogenase-like predicted oxidoreductase